MTTSKLSTSGRRRSKSRETRPKISQSSCSRRIKARPVQARAHSLLSRRSPRNNQNDLDSDLPLQRDSEPTCEVSAASPSANVRSPPPIDRSHRRTETETLREVVSLKKSPRISEAVIEVKADPASEAEEEAAAQVVEVVAASAVVEVVAAAAAAQVEEEAAASEEEAVAALVEEVDSLEDPVALRAGRASVIEAVALKVEKASEVEEAAALVADLASEVAEEVVALVEEVEAASVVAVVEAAQVVEEVASVVAEVEAAPVVEEVAPSVAAEEAAEEAAEAEAHPVDAEAEVVVEVADDDLFIHSFRFKQKSTCQARTYTLKQQRIHLVAKQQQQRALFFLFANSSLYRDGWMNGWI